MRKLSHVTFSHGCPKNSGCWGERLPRYSQVVGALVALLIPAKTVQAPLYARLLSPKAGRFRALGEIARSEAQ